MLLERFRNERIVPVIEIAEVEKAGALADAISAGGLGCAEVTLRTTSALESIKVMAERHDLLVGAGTVLFLDQAKAAVDAGASFIVSPGLSKTVVSWCIGQGVPVFPGCATSTEILQAVEAGVQIVKFFPAELLGGANMLRAFASVFGSVGFMPTGGIGLDNVKQYLALDSVIACGGSWMVRPEWIKEGDFERVRNEVAAAAALQRDFEGDHL